MIKFLVVYLSFFSFFANANTGDDFVDGMKIKADSKISCFKNVIYTKLTNNCKILSCAPATSDRVIKEGSVFTLHLRPDRVFGKTELYFNGYSYSQDSVFYRCDDETLTQKQFSDNIKGFFSIIK